MTVPLTMMTLTRRTRLSMLALLALLLPGVANAAPCPGPDAFGYMCHDVPFNFIDIRDTGIDAGVDCDDCVSAAIPLPFTFDYYGVEYDSIYVSSNGFISVLEGQGDGCCSGEELPSGDFPNGTIAGSWKDLCPDCGASSSVKYETVGNTFVVQFTGVPRCCSDVEPVTMQYQFRPDGSIQMHFDEVNNDGAQLSIGIENETGTDGLQFFFGSDSPPAQTAVEYSTAAAGASSVFVDLVYPADGSEPLTLVVVSFDPDAEGFTAYLWLFTPNLPLELAKIDFPAGLSIRYISDLFNPGGQIVCAYAIDAATQEAIASDCDPGGRALPPNLQISETRRLERILDPSALTLFRRDRGAR